MRPIKLELSGLNSYIDKATVDFEKLTDRGLFGIFGNTGSGKSTILDAITIAMYGNISRNTKEFINSSCDKAIISYEFEIGSKNTKRRYKVDRTIVRTNTGTKTSYARLVEIKNDEEETVLADKVGDVNTKVTQIVGLTANDFTRSVVLPQGKFNDFLKLTGSERRDMLERIFNLEKYGRGLIDKVRKRKNIQNQSLRDITSKLSQYDGVNEQVYDGIEKQLEELKELEKIKNNEFESAQQKYTESSEIYEKQVQKENYEKRKKELDLKNQEIRDKATQLENAINAEKINPYIFEVQKLDKKINEDNSHSEMLEKKLEILSKELLLSKNKYEEAYQNKNENMPKLSEEKTKLQRAFKLEEELISLDKELKEIKEKGTSLNKEKDILEKSKLDLESKKEIIAKSVKDLESKISKLKISADLKQKIFLAYEYEKENNTISNEKSTKLDRLDEISKNLDDVNLKIKYVQRDKNLVESKLNEYQIHQDCLNKKSPGENEDIVSKTEYVTSLRLKIDIIKENEAKKDELQSDLNKILEQKHHVERELIALNDRLDSTKRHVDDLEKELDKLRYLNLALELRKELKENMPCPVCGSRHHDNLDKVNQDEQIAFTRSKLEKLKQEEHSIKNNIDDLNSKNSEYVSAEKIKLKEMEEVKSKIGELKSSELSSRLDEESKKLEILKINVQRWQQDKEDTDNKLKKLKEEKNLIEKEELKLQENINTYKKLSKDLKEEIEVIDVKLKKVKEEYIGLKAIVKIQDLGSKVIEINKNEKTIEDLNKQYQEVAQTKDNIENEIKKYQDSLHKTELELMKAREIYTEKRKVRDEKYNDIIAITKGEPSKSLLESLELSINKLIIQEESTKKKLEEQRLEYDKYSTEKSNVDGRLKIAKEQFESQSSILNQLLIDYKFESIYAVKRALLEPDHKRRLHDEITEYDEEQKILTLKIDELIEYLGGRTVKPEVFEELKNKIYNLKVEVGTITKDIGAKQNTLNTLRESIEKVKELNKVLKVVQHRVDLLEDLDKIVQGNRFVEYVATNQLKYIALEASKRLEGITKGRYALEIDSTLNFVMRDNFNGGQRRSVDTLSGGETFLTSLSLALALSSQIQLKGSAPLEFFFLDEGFGSLDNELLEVVMESLEKLHSDKLSVGIISHVEELKNRVPIKLVVSPSEAGSGSKVKIEYS
ncbi:AAA family ATPase [Romboutsia lituseburensis]|uniref:AAA family ATPase n=1 Tax=Romboutsia lituseburensis TaxID=1537 RepID=UPI00215B2EB3|nr:SbcC/MukB-like Walker B domain-containing protein [Romboutsia lituseburensis]MCR8746446.1 AAA family ATPase [Romboutsia lituseburensis]